MTQVRQPAKLYRARPKGARPPFRFEPARDPVILKAHYDYRILNSDQLAQIVVSRLPEFTINNHQVIKNSIRGVKDRIRLLVDHRFLQRPIEQAPVRYMKHQAAMTMLDYQGGQYLIHEEGYDPKAVKNVQNPISDRYIPHEIGLNGFRLVLEAGLPTIGFQLATWERAGKEISKSWTDYNGDHVVNPDGFCSVADLTGTQTDFFFVEYDRGNVSAKRMRQRFLDYYLFLKNGYHRKHPYNVNANRIRIITVFEDDAVPVRSSKRDHVEDMKQWVRQAVPNSQGHFAFLRASKIHQSFNYTVKENGNPVRRQTARYVPEAIALPVFETPKFHEPQPILVPKGEISRTDSVLKSEMVN